MALGNVQAPATQRQRSDHRQHIGKH